MKINLITENKIQFMSLLKLADETRFIANYLEHGEMWTFENRIVAIVHNNELLNFAVAEPEQGKGLGGQFLSTLKEKYPCLMVRTDEFTAEFYEKCGFKAYKRIKNYFPDKYGRPVFDKEHELKDNIYLKVCEYSGREN
ncbi:MAG: GNAT family N-acetyltransferase [Streptococcaceae bacterium]|jgi:GNAT superfamily N-acetyltransferase|nr:GNAT family N-acetyltransferase [Streptococcaceae bacterium]